MCSRSLLHTRTFTEKVSAILSSMIGHWPALRIFALCSKEREDTELPHIRKYPALPYISEAQPSV